MPFLPDRFQGGSVWADTKLNSTAVQVGTGGTSVGNSTTTSVLLPKPACTTCQLVAVQVDVLVAAVSASGTVLAQVFKRDNSGTPADRTLTGTLSIEADIVTVADKTFLMPITATAAANVTFQASDACRIDLVTTNTVGTQPTATFVGQWAIIKP